MCQRSIASLTATVCGLFAVPPPRLAVEPSLPGVDQLASDLFDQRGLERCLIYCPDAVGDHLWSRFPSETERMRRYCPERVQLTAVTPSKTPVCYASIFTGAQPEQHGIRKPERPVLACDTLFDALLRAGKQVAICAVRGSSIDLIFRERSIDYYPEQYDREVTARTLALLEDDSYHLMVVYHQEFDDQVHETEPYSPTCLQAFRNHVRSLEQLAETCAKAWHPYNYAIIVAPDHGAHADPESGAGTHGLDIPEDMNVSHWYGLYRHSA